MLAQVASLLIARFGENIPEWFAEHAGFYHLAGDGYASRFEWAEAILRFKADLPRK